MNKIKERAGLIPFHIGESNEPRMMFMKPSDAKFGGTEFQIAKGHIDLGENPLKAAIREAGEELGLSESNILWIRKVGIFLTNHHIYIAEVKNIDGNKFTTPTFETEITTWLSETEFQSIGKPLHQPIVKKCIALFKSIHGETE